jgi:hypothetical protein
MSRMLYHVPSQGRLCGLHAPRRDEPEYHMSSTSANLLLTTYILLY